MGTVVDFINHGILPFTGRTEERERIIQFWRTTFDAHGLRAMLFVGEGGIGKSRLIEESLPAVTEQGGVVLHLKIYPEGTMSLPGLLAESLGRLFRGRGMLVNPPEPTLSAVIGALRRLSRLRAMLLVVEDVHLLSGESLREFSLLVEALSDETLSLLCAARPVELSVRGVLDPYIAEEIELKGLEADDLGQIVHELLGGGIGPQTVQALQQATLGNPLAVRSALRGAVRTGQFGTTNDTPLSVDKTEEARLEQIFRRSATRYSEGLGSGLNQAEREGAEMLAWLGEVFSREAAVALLADRAEHILQFLRFRGVIAEITLPVPPFSVRQSSTLPLAFTHSLLHRQLVEESTVDINQLVRVVAVAPPFFSVLPFELIQKGTAHCTLSPEIAANAISAMLESVSVLENSADWSVAPVLREATKQLLSTSGITWPVKLREQYEVRLLNAEITYLQTRFNDSPKRASMVNELVSRTQQVEDEEGALARIAALTYAYKGFSGVESERHVIEQEIEEIVVRFPPVIESLEYALWLKAFALHALLKNRERLKQVEENYERIVANPNVQESAKHRLEWMVVPNFLFLYNTQDEFARRERMLRQLYSGSVPINLGDQRADYHARFLQIQWLYNAGYVDELLTLVPQLSQVSQDMDLKSDHLSVETVGFAGRMLLGLSSEEVEEEGRRLAALMDIVRTANPIHHKLSVDVILGYAFLCYGDRDLPFLFEVFQVDPANIDPQIRFMCGWYNGHSNGEKDDLIVRMVETVRSQPHNADVLERAVVPILDSSFIRVPNIMNLYAVVALLRTELSDPVAGMSQFRERIIAHLLSALERFANPKRRLPLLMRNLLNGYGELLSDAERAKWEERTVMLEREREEERQLRKKIGRDGTRVPFLSMIGTITIHTVESQDVLLRGGRVKTLVGLLVADCMLEHPLEKAEFTRIASGENDPERGRNIVKTTVHRVREVFGFETLTVRDGRPWLNQDAIDVDLLTAHNNCASARVAMKEGGFLRAARYLEGALEIVGGDVPFPGLYDRFFEAMRDEFDVNLRRSVLDLAEGLIAQGDAGGATRILRSGMRALPDDQEMADLLHHALMEQGNLTEAERVRAGLEL